MIKPDNGYDTARYERVDTNYDPNLWEPVQARAASGQADGDVLTSLDAFRKANPRFDRTSDPALFEYIHKKYYPGAEKGDLAIALGYDDGSRATVGDYGRAAMAGFAGLAEAAGKGISMLPGDTATEIGKKIQDVGKESADWWQESMTPAGRRAMSNEIVTDDFEIGNTPLQSIGMQALISAPSMLAAAIPGIGITGTVAKIGGKTLATLAAHPGVVGFLARHLPTAIGFGTAEGGVAALQNASQTEYEIRRTPIEKLRAESPAFQKFYSETDPALPQERRDALALDATAKVAADDVALKTLFSTGGIGIATGGGAMGMLSRMFGVKGAQEAVKFGFIKAVAKGVGQEALQETPQSGMEAYIQNRAMQEHVAPSTDPMKDVVSQALSGGIVGGVTGGVAGGAGYFVQRPEAGPVLRSDAEVVTGITQAPTMDDAISAAKTAVEAPPPLPVAVPDPNSLPNAMQIAFQQAQERAAQAKRPDSALPVEKGTAAATTPQTIAPTAVPSLTPDKPIAAPAPPSVTPIAPQIEPVLPQQAPVRPPVKRASPSTMGEVTPAQARPANVVIRQVRDRDANNLGSIMEPYDGTMEGARQAAQRATDRMWEQYGEASNIQSRIGATDENGNPKWAISPNLKHIQPADSVEGRAIFGDEDAIYGESAIEAAPAKPDIASRRKSADDLNRLANDDGWIERGGRIIRDGQGASQEQIDQGRAHEVGNVVGRTKWIPKAEWYQKMRQELGAKGLSGRGEIRAAVDGWLRGAKLGKRAQNTVDYMLAEIERERQAYAEQKGVTDDLIDDVSLSDLSGSGVEVSGENQAITDLITTARQLDEDALERLSIRHQDSPDSVFMDAVIQFIEERKNADQRSDAKDTRAVEEDSGTPQGFSLAQPTTEDPQARADKVTAAEERSAGIRDSGQEAGVDRQGGEKTIIGLPGFMRPASQWWDKLTKEQKLDAAVRAGWATNKGTPNFVAKNLARQKWAEIADQTRATLARKAWPDMPPPHRLTSLEYARSYVPQTTQASNNQKSQHRIEVKAALARGEAVPEKVLAEYHDLAETKPEARTAPTVAEKPQAPATQEPGDAGAAPGREGGAPGQDDTAKAVTEVAKATAEAVKEIAGAVKELKADIVELRKAPDETAKAEKPQPAAKEDGTKITDVGENLWYNRRNFTGKGIQWEDVKDLNDTLKVREVTKAKVWRKPDYEQLVADGMPAPIAHLIKQVYDSIATSPAVRGTPTDADLQLYIETVQRVRDGVFEFANDSGAVRALLGSSSGRGQVSLTALADTQKRLLEYAFPGYEPGALHRGGQYFDAARVIGGNKALGALQPGRDELMRAMKAVEQGWPAAQEAWQKQGYRVVETKDQLRLIEGSRYEDGKSIPQFYVKSMHHMAGSFDTREEAQALIDSKKPWLLTDKYGLIAGEFDTREAAVGAAREKTKRENRGGEIRGMNIAEAERTGPERRANGENVTSERLMQEFGFRGVNFGREGWINQTERQAYLNHAYDALLDLSEILGIPPKALSLNGTLGIAFGAQGRGGVNAAHFVPGVNEINMTKTKGAGTLAHEWAHGLDHYFAVQAGLSKEKSPFLSEHASRAKTFGEGIRPEIVAAFKAIHDAMKQRPLTEGDMAMRRQERIAEAKKRLEGWIGGFRKYIERTATDKGKALAEFDRAAEKMRNGDLGEGYAKAGRMVLRPRVAEIREIVNQYAKNSSINFPDNWKGLQANAEHVAYLLSERAAAAAHIPQTGSTDYARESAAKDKDKGGKQYWSTSWEMFARAFEMRVADRLAEQERVNTFLSDAAIRAGQKNEQGRYSQPYPRGVDREAINAAFDKLIETIETRETDMGMEMFSRRLYTIDKDNPIAHDFIVPETPEFDGNTTGDLAYTPRSAEAKGIEQLPIRLTVGKVYGPHRGFGLIHIAEEGDAESRRKAPEVTADRAENEARRAAAIANNFNEIYTEGNRVIFRSQVSREAIVAERINDPETGESFYSVVTITPSAQPVWGEPVWRAGRAVHPADRTLKPGAPDRRLTDESSSQAVNRMGDRQTERFDLSKERERLQAARKQVAGKDVKVTQKKRRVFRAKDDPQYSRAFTKDDTPASIVFTLLAQNDQLFQLPASEAKTMRGIADEAWPDLKVREYGREEARGHSATGLNGWEFSVQARNGRTQKANAVELPRGEIYLNISDFTPGGGGNRIYAVVANYARNNGKTFIGDPYGLSEIAVLRRTSAMISTALKFGTTDHIKPHEVQTEGNFEKGIPPLAWEDGNTAFNINSLLQTESYMVLKAVPEARAMVYNFKESRFEDTRDGKPVTDADFAKLAEQTRLRLRGIGSATIKRAVLVQSAVPEVVQGQSGRHDILAAVSRLAAPGGLEGSQLGGILYKRRDGSGRGVTAGEIRTHLSRAIKAIIAPVTVYDTVAAARADGIDAPNDSRGFSAHGRIGLIAESLPDMLTAEETLWHEIQHFGVRALHKSSEAHEAYRAYQATLTKVAMANQNVRKRAAEWRAKYGKDKTEQYRAIGLEGAELENAVRVASWDEAIAEIAGDRRGKPIKFLNELIAALQRLLRALGFDNLANWMEGKTDAEVLSLIRRSTEAAMASDSVSAVEQPAYSRETQLAPIWYSALERGLESLKIEAMPAAQWKAWLKSNAAKLQIKQDEIDAVSLNEWLDLQQGRITKADVLAYLSQNGVRVEEVTLGGDPDPAYKKEYNRLTDMRDRGGQLSHDAWRRKIAELNTRYGLPDDASPSSSTAPKYAYYQLPGGTNYRELLLTLPPQTEGMRAFYAFRERMIQKYGHGHTTDKYTDTEEAERIKLAKVADEKEFRSPHFQEPNILAHVRFNERMDADGRKVLFIEEIQSDWAQKGRKAGFRDIGPSADKRISELQGIPFGKRTSEQQNELDDLTQKIAANSQKIPPAPFVGRTEAWAMLAMKRMIRYAAAEGFERLAWTAGTQQADRYDLSKQVKEILFWGPEVKGDFQPDEGEVGISIYGKNDEAIKEQEIVSHKDLADLVGKELADRIIKGDAGQAEGHPEGVKRLAGLDLKVGGEGMRSFYDVMLPQTVNKYVKKWGAKVGTTTISTNNEFAAETESGQRVIFGNRAEAQAWLDEHGESGAVEEIDTGGDARVVPSLDITHAMRESVMQGQPMFSRRSRDESAEATDGRFGPVRDRMYKTADYLIYNYQDKFIDLKRIQKRVGDVPEDIDAYLAQERYSGQVSARVNDFHDDMLDPLIKAIHDAGLKYDEVEQYLHARHAPSRNAAMKAINPTEAELEAVKAKTAAERDRLRETGDVQRYIDLRRRMRSAEADIEDGLADESLRRVLEDDLRALTRDSEDVRDYIRAVQKLKGLERIQPYQGDNTALSGMSDERAAEIIESARRSGRQEALDRVAEMVDAITAATRKIYVDAGLEKPETVAAWEAKYEHYVPLHRDEVGEYGMPAVGQGFSVRGPESKRAVGSTKDVTDILAHVAAQHEAAIIRAEKSKVDRVLYEFARANPDEYLWTLDTADKQQVVDPVTGTVASRVNPAYKQKPNVLTFKIDGEERTITFNENSPEAMRLALSMKNLAAHDLGEVTQLIGKFTRFLATMNTSANPVFVARNFLRDLSTAFINLSDTELAGMKKDVYRDIPKAIRGMWQMSRGNMDSEWAGHAREFRDAGGQMGWLEHYKDIDARAVNLRKKLAALDSGAWNLTKREAKAWWSLIEDANLAVENGVRLAAYVNARRAGLSEAKAASIAKNLTVNFNRHGAKGVELNMWYMFLNASIQGTARIFKALGNKSVQKIIGYVIASGFLMDMLARALAGDGDDDGENDYDRLPEYVKAHNFVFWAGRPITIPMPYGYNFFASVGRKMSEAMFRKNFSTARGAVELVDAFLNAFNPLGQSSSIAQTILPTIADPLVQWSENKNFAGFPLRREQIPFGPPKPEYQMGLKSTSAPAKWLAEALNDVTGGNEVRPGALNINPGLFDFAVSSLTGGAGRTYLQAFSLPIKTMAGEEVQAREVPFANIFMGSKPEYQTQRVFYENLRAVELAEDEHKRYLNDPEMRRRIRENYGAELRMVQRAKQTSSLLKKLREREKMLERSKVADKDKMLKQLDERRQEIMRDFNKRYNEARH